MGVGDIEEPIGRSVYNALQTSYKQRIASPFRGVNAMDLIISYTLSRYTGTGGDDQNFSAVAWDNNNPTSYMGPTSLDRTHAFKFGATFDVAHHGPRFSLIGNFGSPHPAFMVLATEGGQLYPQTGEIFRTDVTGDGSVGDLFNPNGGPGRPGQLSRSISPSNLTNAINQWNNTVAGTLTPAGQALVTAGLISTADLQGLQATKPYLANTPPGTVAGAGFFKEVTSSISWPIKLRENLTIEPSIGAFNLFNFANWDIPRQFMSNMQVPYQPNVTCILPNATSNPNGLPPCYGAAGSVTGSTTGANRESLRHGTGSGVFSNGAPRQVEFGLKINF
jgi:hypothetical protein